MGVNARGIDELDPACTEVVRLDNGECGKFWCAPPVAMQGSITEYGFSQKEEFPMPDTWLTTLITESPQAGFELAITLSRRGVKYTQPDADVLKRLRPEYAEDADSLTAASQVIAIHFQTIAAANNYWRD